MIKVLVYAANSIFRAGLESLLRSDSTLKVVGSCSDWLTFEQLLIEQQADVLLIETSKVPSDFFTRQKLFFGGEFPPAIVILSPQIEREEVIIALAEGVQAYLPTWATASELVMALKAALKRLIILHPDVSELIIDSKLDEQRPLFSSEIESLTPREIEVLQMLAQGLANKAIASRLNISEHTVKFHLSSIFTKLNASSRTEAVTIGLRGGLIWL